MWHENKSMLFIQGKIRETGAESEEKRESQNGMIIMSVLQSEQKESRTRTAGEEESIRLLVVEAHRHIQS